MDTLDQVVRVSKLSAEHFACLDELAKNWLVREDGLTKGMKLMSLIHAGLKHLKVLHLVMQAELPTSQDRQRLSFSQFLQHVALEEEKEEGRAKGGT